LNKQLETILNELNPVHDLDNVNLNMPRNDSHRDNVKQHKKQMLFFVANHVKHLARGALYGGVLGGLLDMADPSSSGANFSMGVHLGACVDVLQYIIRTAPLTHEAGEDFQRYLNAYKWKIESETREDVINDYLNLDKHPFRNNIVVFEVARRVEFRVKRNLSMDISDSIEGFELDDEQKNIVGRFSEIHYARAQKSLKEYTDFFEEIKPYIPKAQMIRSTVGALIGYNICLMIGGGNLFAGLLGGYIGYQIGQKNPIKLASKFADVPFKEPLDYYDPKPLMNMTINTLNSYSKVRPDLRKVISQRVD